MEYRFNASPVYTFDVERGQRAVKKQRLRTLLLPLLPPLLLLLLLVSGRLLASLVNPPCFLSAYTHRISPSCSFARRVNFCRGFSLSLSSPSSSVVFLAFFSLLDFPSVFFCFCKFVGSFFFLSLFVSFFHTRVFFPLRIKRMIECGDESVSGFRRLFVVLDTNEFFIRSIFVRMRDRI